jgi:phenylpropionate dioxygenase-like ring-hydroxylating dioxygenase large terminal subunit
LVLFRGQDGQVSVLDAYCPHMGAHLAEGHVDGEGLRCMFHGWKFGGDGACVDVPCLKRSHSARVRAWPVIEHYGLIWVYTGEVAACPPPEVPELGRIEVRWAIGKAFTKACHPNVVMVNAIDAHHFNTVHNMPVKLDMQDIVASRQNIRFENTTVLPRDRWWKRFLARFYAGPLTYRMSYHFGSTGIVTVGPDFWHAHILFALRPGADGQTLGQTVLPVRKRPGFSGWVVNQVEIVLARIVGAYFAKGDTKIFSTIHFDLQNPLPQDRAILRFMAHLEGQARRTWGSWELQTPARSEEAAS